MKIYVAAKFEMRAQLPYIFDELKHRGHEITFDWTVHEVVRKSSDRIVWAKEDHQGVVDADALVFLPPGGNGAHVEIGIAIGLSKPVHIIGPVPEKVFYNHPLVQHHESLAHFIERVSGVEV